ncbi:nucleotidyltransferase family protein [Alkalicoccus luteus]|uniref:nucleotidyltransferase family protein n=1 Tax=Alkalicoccus luteus TaxID=1237094 RepID=UPI00403404AE
MGTEAANKKEMMTLLRSIIENQLSGENVRVYLFGSWARKQEKHSSDIDIAVESVDPISPAVWNSLLDEIEESAIPYKVDVVDLDTTNAVFKERVKKEGVIWKDYISD